MSSRTRTRAPRLRAPARAEFLRDVLEGLESVPKRISPKYFYDERGSALFEEITEVPEYYLTRTEMAIMERSVGEIATRIGAGAALIELGSGTSRKTRLLLAALDRPAGYVPVDLNCGLLVESARGLRAEFPGLPVIPVCADFLTSFVVPELPVAPARRVVYFPGSTIGNLDAEDVALLFQRVAVLAGPGGGFLVGVDLRKDPAVLEAAYNDALGVTRAFNLNLLERIARELGADLDPDQFEHHAFYNEAEGRVEMHLVSLAPQEIRLEGHTIPFREGETIHTENSYKYAPDGLAGFARAAGFVQECVWTDERRFFSVQYFSVGGGALPAD